MTFDAYHIIYNIMRNDELSNYMGHFIDVDITFP